MPPEQVGPDLWVLTDIAFDVPSQWREWLGSIRTDEVADSNLFLVSKLASSTPGVLDDENQALQRSVQHFYVGLLLSAMFSPSHKPIMLTGARQDVTIDIRQQSNLDLPAPQVFRRYPPIVCRRYPVGGAARTEARCHGLGNRSRWAVAVFPDAEHLRRNACNRRISIPDSPILPLHRWANPARHWKGLGNSSRAELNCFIGPGHHDLMGALYDIRSHVEHLHENRYLETFDRHVRLDLVKKEAIVEYIARTALARIVSRDALWPHFGNTAALEKFWALSPDERREMWGRPH